MNRPRAADDFATIRARLEELRREVEQAKPSGKDRQPDPLLPRGVSIRRPSSEINVGAGKGSPAWAWYKAKFSVGSLISA